MKTGKATITELLKFRILTAGDVTEDNENILSSGWNFLDRFKLQPKVLKISIPLNTDTVNPIIQNLHRYVYIIQKTSILRIGLLLLACGTLCIKKSNWKNRLFGEIYVVRTFNSDTFREMSNNQLSQTEIMSLT